MDFPARLTAHLGSAARVSGWICVAAIAYLSLVPHSMEIRTPLPGCVEHAIAYAGTAVLLKLGYPRKALFVIASALFAYSGILDIRPSWVVEHSEVIGALWSGGGARLGALPLRPSFPAGGAQSATINA